MAYKNITLKVNKDHYDNMYKAYRKQKDRDLTSIKKMKKNE